MPKQLSPAGTETYNTPIRTREVITEGETAYKSRQTERDQETFDMVRAKDASDPKFSWAAEYINGKVRVTTRPRA